MKTRLSQSARRRVGSGELSTNAKLSSEFEEFVNLVS